MSAGRASPASRLSTCTRCGASIPSEQVRYCLGRITCQRCWNDLVRTGILTWLPFSDERGEEPERRHQDERLIA